MIIRRIAEAFRRQDWFTVCVEVLIVVFGVFIGLQVDDWNSQRVEREMERQYLERLLADAESSVVAVTDASKILDRFIDGTVLVLSALQKKTLDPDDTLKFHHAIADFSGLSPINPNLTTLYELQSAGRLSLIQNFKLRGQLVQLATQTSYMESQLNFMRDKTNNLSDDLLSYWQTTMDLDLATATRLDKYSFDPDITAANVPVQEFSVLAEQPELETLTSRMLQNRLRFRGFVERYREQTIAVRDTLNAELAHRGWQAVEENAQ